MAQILAFSIWFFFHPVHVTLTSIDYIRGTDSLKVYVKMYYDDFLLDYRNTDILNDSVVKTGPVHHFPEELMNNYLNEKVSIIVNNKELKGKLLNLNIAENEVNINMLYKTARKPGVITVKNIIMTGLYKDQANMLIVKVDDFEQGVKLTPDTPEQTFRIKQK
jgi:hypothetical protein